MINKIIPFKKNFRIKGIIIEKKEPKITLHSQATLNLSDEAIGMYLSAIKSGH